MSANREKGREQETGGNERLWREKRKTGGEGEADKTARLVSDCFKPWSGEKCQRTRSRERSRLVRESQDCSSCEGLATSCGQRRITSTALRRGRVNSPYGRERPWDEGKIFGARLELGGLFASGVPDLRLKDLACCQVLLELYIPSPEGLCGVREAVCTLSQQKLHAIEDSMYDNIDFFKLFHLLPRVLDHHTAGPDLRLWGKVLLGTSKKLHQCLDLDKFVGLSVEGQMTVKTLDLQGENKLWAGLVFLDMTPWTSELPARIKFRIHMDIDSVERTNETNNREFNPLVMYCLISQAKIFQIT
ncbi:retinal-specific phospholipid-transporting ATPase ABCA4-like [Brienomyrus brachyistius]|uniref:retinal-specific phospholipid-transporting ATPase ABCA4-like n=1 Tax=Brienomyrus brachyistius TaxID=42636 RepID=UPI0020B1EBA3|nr:retinal-specific phospholipid-transporting ATPase ABCA4-like [Brienomyrus brachyistius]